MMCIPPAALFTFLVLTGVAGMFLGIMLVLPKEKVDD